MTLYNALVLPHLSYSCIVWGWASAAALDRISKLQKRVVRLITNSHFQAHSDPLFYKLNILKVGDICKLQTAMVLYSSLYECSTYAGAFYLRFNFQRVIKKYSTRSDSNSLHIPHCRTVIRSNAIACKGPSVWNSLPGFLTYCTSRFCFKKQYKLYLIQNYLNLSA